MEGKIMYSTNACYGANNYIDILYTLSNTTINPHIDRISFGCNNEIVKPVDKLVSILEANNYECKYDKGIKRNAYKRIKRYCSSITGVSVPILYERKRHCCIYPCMRVIVDNPHRDTIDWFDTICNSLGFITTLSQVELTIDFSPYEYGLQEFLWNHLFLKHHGGNVSFVGDKKSLVGNKESLVGDDFPNTFYLGHKAKNSKSVIVYDKKVNDLNVLRLEFRLNRSFLKRRELELDTFENINNIDLSNLISFKRINRGKLSKHLQWRHKKQILRLGKEYKGMYVRQLMYSLGDERSVANMIACMKRSPYKNNCQRFLEDMPEANEAFFKRLKGAKFI
jgi:hypothetical protein